MRASDPDVVKLRAAPKDQNWVDFVSIKPGTVTISYASGGPSGQAHIQVRCKSSD